MYSFKSSWLVLMLLFVCPPITASTDDRSNNMAHNKENLAKATFAGGCFWCMEPPFGKLDGVVATTAGYTGGHKENPTYQEVSSGETGHTEALQVTYDPQKINYSQLLEVFWHNINPADSDGQFADRGSQYRPAIFHHDEEQKQLAEESRDKLAESGRFKSPVKTEIVPLGTFFPAEDYHQDYYQKSPDRYKSYRYHSGRDQFLKKVWGDEKK
ncbi:MAG: peptide-methionine (S)-S-oxide reductase MsrA [Desulfuromonadales bacterium]|nr:peptide-methionine (S)-S-oxide reductase MsrA [Desulfuromonadales bacterium]